MDMNIDMDSADIDSQESPRSQRSPAPAAAAATGAQVEPPRAPRRALTYTIVGGALLTMLAVLATHRPHRLAGPAATSAGPGVVASVPVPAAPTSPAASPPAAPPAAVKARPRVEVVFALDTTSSMGGLIEGAKQKIWSLASFIAQGQPTPDLRVGLVAYRDVGDAYVTKVFDLDQDLDRVYRRLRSFRAEGGGDTPEHVARALDEAVRKMSWTQAPEVVKVIYLVGDAPPHTDYNDGYDVGRSARAAAARGIQLHTIQCGTDHEAEASWRRIAALGGGQFMAIQQDGGMHEERSRYDDELAMLHDRLAETTIAYGADRAAVDTTNREAEAAPASVKAARAAFMAKSGRAIAGKGDLVDSVGSGAVKLEEVQAELPKEMRAMDVPAQHAAIAAKQKARKDISQRIDELSRLRQADLDAQERVASKGGAADGFDVAAKKALRRSVESNAAAGLKL
jgi:hypothetical protein